MCCLITRGVALRMKTSYVQTLLSMPWKVFLREMNRKRKFLLNMLKNASGQFWPWKSWLCQTGLEPDTSGAFWMAYFFLFTFCTYCSCPYKGDTIACIYIFDIPLCYDVCLKLLTSCSYIHLGRSTKITKNIVPTLKCAFICCCSFCQVSCKMFVLSQLGLYWRNTPWCMWRVVHCTEDCGSE